MSTKKNILVTGANGQLGMEFRELETRYPQYNFLFTGRNEISIEEEELLEKYFAENIIHYCINCAAYTAVDKAETQKDYAKAVNTYAVAKLAAVCKNHGTFFIHFSTDYVFDGNGNIPYKETDETNPVNFYGETKLAGEQIALEKYNDVIVIRTSWVYSHYGNNFVKTMLRLMNEKESIGVVSDQRGCPTYAADLAAAVMQAIESNKMLRGIYHYCNEGVISWYEFAMAIKEISGSNCVVNPITTKDYPTAAKRPSYSALDTQKIRQTYDIIIPHWKQSLEICISKIQELN